jgi:HAE1 family hydrophobic/amphiphilic exporter-1
MFLRNFRSTLVIGLSIPISVIATFALIYFSGLSLNLMTSLVLVVMLVYMVMAAQFESLKHPFVIMFSVPMAAIGVLWMLYLTGTTFNMQSNMWSRLRKPGHLKS